MKRERINLNKYWKILVLCILFFAVFLAYDHVKTQTQMNKHMEQMMQAFALDPDAVKIQEYDGHDITAQFMGTYLNKIREGKYAEPIKAIRGKGYRFSISSTPKNEDFLYQMNNKQK